MHPDQSCFFGFDADADGELTMVTLRREPDGGWHVEQVDGPQDEDMSHLVARICEPPRPRPGEAATTTAPSAAEVREKAEQWMAKHGDLTLQLTDWQRQALLASFERLIAEGKLRL